MSASQATQQFEAGSQTGDHLEVRRTVRAKIARNAGCMTVEVSPWKHLLFYFNLSILDNPFKPK